MGYEIEKDWITNAGLRAVVIMAKHKTGEERHRCGYVGLDPDHHLYKIKYEAQELPLHVHGGVTYSGGGDDYPVESDLWWLGFDCAHWGDYSKPAKTLLNKHSGLFLEEGIFRSLEYCIDECEALAKQLKEGEQDGND